MSSVDQLTADDFSAYLERLFRPVGTELDLRLVKISQHEFSGWDAAPRKPFSLILHGPPHPVLAEGIHRIAIADGPILTLYVIPILTAGRDRQDYQIVFN
jgi:hypothetical protein